MWAIVDASKGASRRLGIHYVALRRRIYSGGIHAVRTPTGRWMMPEGRVERIWWKRGSEGSCLS